MSRVEIGATVQRNPDIGFMRHVFYRFITASSRFFSVPRFV